MASNMMKNIIRPAAKAKMAIRITAHNGMSFAYPSLRVSVPRLYSAVPIQLSHLCPRTWDDTLNQNSKEIDPPPSTPAVDCDLGCGGAGRERLPGWSSQVMSTLDGLAVAAGHVQTRPGGWVVRWS